jgi:hypothetical protein
VLALSKCKALSSNLSTDKGGEGERKIRQGREEGAEKPTG